MKTKKPVAISEPNVKVQESVLSAENVRIALMSEFCELWDCDRVDLRPLWTHDDCTRYRLNGWKDGQCVLSRFVKVWMDNGLKYSI